MSVAIYSITLGCDVWIWLCEDCLEARQLKGWMVKERKEPPHRLPCQDCEEKEPPF